MKNKNISKSFGIYLSIIFFFSACNYSSSEVVESMCIEGTGPVVEEQKQFTELIHSIVNNISANVHIVQGKEQNVKIKAQKNIIDQMSLRVSKGVLEIKFLGNCVTTKLPIEVFITISEIKKLTTNGSGKFIGHNLWKSPNLSIVINGSGDTNAEINSTTVSTIISGSGKVNLKGNTSNQTINIKGSGGYNALELLSDKTSIEINGSGDCQVQVNKNLDVIIDGSGRVYYKGSPTLTTKISGSGTVIQIP